MSSKLIAKVIAENASRHNKLLESIARLEDAPTLLAQNSSTISELQAQVEECEANVERLFEKTRKERTRADNSEKFGSGFKFWKGKSKSSDSGQKRSFAEAMQEEMRERDRLAALQQSLAAAQAQKPELTARLREYEELDSQLDALYSLVFSGPTPGYPQEDALEQQVEAARSVHQRVSANLFSESQALEQLVRAEKTMREAHSKLKDGIYWATALAMLAGGRSAEAKEASALKGAHSLARKAELEYQEGQSKSPHVRTLERSRLARELPERHENDNTFHEELKVISAELATTQSQLTAERKASAVRVTSTKLVVSQAEQTLADYRRELNTVRRRIFEDVVEKVNNGEYNIEDEDEELEGSADAPPSYDAPHQQTSPLELAKYVQYMSLGGGDLSNLTGGMAAYQRNLGNVSMSNLHSPVHTHSESFGGGHGGLTVDSYGMDGYLSQDPYGDEPMSPLSPAGSMMSVGTSMSRSYTIDGYRRTAAGPSTPSSSRRPLPRPPQAP